MLKETGKNFTLYLGLMITSMILLMVSSQQLSQVGNIINETALNTWQLLLFEPLLLLIGTIVQALGELGTMLLATNSLDLAIVAILTSATLTVLSFAAEKITHSAKTA